MKTDLEERRMLFVVVFFYAVLNVGSWVLSLVIWSTGPAGAMLFVDLTTFGILGIFYVAAKLAKRVFPDDD